MVKCQCCGEREATTKCNCGTNVCSKDIKKCGICSGNTYCTSCYSYCEVCERIFCNCTNSHKCSGCSKMTCSQCVPAHANQCGTKI